MPRILVVGGHGEGGIIKKTELWPKPDSQCPLPNFPLKVSGAVGFWTAQGPTVCGGQDGEERHQNKCFLYRKHLFNVFPFPSTPPHTVGPCTVQNPTAPKFSRGKLGKEHWESGLGHNCVFFLESPFPVTTKMRGTVK